MSTLFSANESTVQILPGHDDRENNWPRILGGYVGDLSGSMSEYLRRVLIAFALMVNALNKHATARQRVELACAMFASRVVMQSFAPLSFYVKEEMDFNCGGMTALGTALDTVIEQTSRRRQALLARGVECSDCFWVVFTDGAATDDIDLVLPKIRQAEQSGEIQFVPVAPDEDSLERLAKIFKQEAVLLSDLDFDLLFRVFGRSLRSCSQGQSGQSLNIAALMNREIQRKIPYHDFRDEQDLLPAPQSPLHLPCEEE